MPELPEVQTIVNDLLRAGIVESQITDCKILFPKTVEKHAPREFINSIVGQTIKNVSRRGKYIVFDLSNSLFIAIHLRMTGRFYFRQSEKLANKHEHVLIELNNKRWLIYHDTRKFGRWTLFADWKAFFERMGPEPLDPHFTLKDFSERLHKSKRKLKALLLDQSFIAGLGNIYVDEALWEAHLHPEQFSHQLTPQHIKKLFEAIKCVLNRGIETEGTTLGSGKTNYYRLDGTKGKHQDRLNIFRKTGQPCPRCGTSITRLKIAQRSTHVCSKCQITG